MTPAPNYRIGFGACLYMLPLTGIAFPAKDS
jgi:hypothetical protein